MTKSIGSLLALAVTTSIALANSGGGGGDDKKNPYQGGSSWKPGAGITLADSDEFKLTLANQLQVQWAFGANDTAPDTNNFTVRRARTTLSGHVFNKDLMYLLRLDAVDTGANIKDAWAHWNFSKGESGTLGLRVGQSKTYHGLETTGSSAGLFFVERSAASRTFSDARSRGAWVHGSHNENKLRWCAGAQNGDVANGSAGLVNEVGEEANNSDNELTFVGSVSFDPMGDTTGGKNGEAFKQGDVTMDVKELMGTVGAGVMIGNNTDSITNNDLESTQFNINTAWMFGDGLSAQGEIFIRSDDPAAGSTADTNGWYAQVTKVLPKSGDSNVQWGFGLRINQINIDDTITPAAGAPGLGGAAGDVLEVSGVLDAFYHGHACKTQIEYTWQDVNPDAGSSDTNHILRIQFQLLF
jgi:hypothetical protein